MSDIVTKAVEALNEKLGGAGFDGSAKFVIEGEGSVIIDATGARAGSDDDFASVELKADAETYQQIFEGDLNPTAAFMSGRLTIDGDMGLAMKLASTLA